MKALKVKTATFKIVMSQAKIDFIKKALSQGYTVQLTTFLSGVRLKAKHAHMVKLGSDNHVLVKQGKNWVDWEYADLRAFKDY